MKETIDLDRLVRLYKALGDRTRLRLFALLAGLEPERALCVNAIVAQLGVSQPAVSQHLKVLRDSGFAKVEPQGPRRIYELDPAPMVEVDEWLGRFRHFWEPKLEELALEVKRGKRKRRR